MTKDEFHSLIRDVDLDATKYNLLTNAWKNGEERWVYCDGDGCNLSWIVIFLHDKATKQIAVLYPKGTGGFIHRLPENPRKPKRDFCNTCATRGGHKTTQMLIAHSRDAFDLQLGRFTHDNWE